MITYTTEQGKLQTHKDVSEQGVVDNKLLQLNIRLLKAEKVKFRLLKDRVFTGTNSEFIVYLMNNYIEQNIDLDGRVNR